VPLGASYFRKGEVDYLPVGCFPDRLGNILNTSRTLWSSLPFFVSCLSPR